MSPYYLGRDRGDMNEYALTHLVAAHISDLQAEAATDRLAAGLPARRSRRRRLLPQALRAGFPRVRRHGSVPPRSRLAR